MCTLVFIPTYLTISIALSKSLDPVNYLNGTIITICILGAIANIMNLTTITDVLKLLKRWLQ